MFLESKPSTRLKLHKGEVRYLYWAVVANVGLRPGGLYSLQLSVLGRGVYLEHFTRAVNLAGWTNRRPIRIGLGLGVLRVL